MYGSKCQIDYGMGNTTFHEETVPRMKQAFASFCEPLITLPELIYTDRGLSKYKGKSLLILGGGGSTNTFLKFMNFDHDFIWSMNNFYKNPLIKDIHVDLFTVGPEVDLLDVNLMTYLYLYDTVAAFELHQKWGRDFRNPDTGQTTEELWREAEEFYRSDKKICFQTKFYSQLGAGVRLLIFAAHCGFKTVSFIGLDGPEAIMKGDHAFEPGKRQFSRAVQGFNDFTKIKFFEMQYNVFWRYILSLYPETEFISIDIENKYHKVLNG